MISGTTIVSTLPDGQIGLHDLVSRRELCVLPAPDGGPRNRRWPEAVSPDGRLLATVGADVELWDVHSGARLRTLEWTVGSYWRIMSSAFAPDAGLLASGLAPDPELYHQVDCVETTLLWDTDSGRQVRALHGDGGDVNPPFVASVAFSPDGLTLATGSENGAISLFDVATGERIRRLAVGSTVTGVLAFSPDGTVLGSSRGLIDLTGRAKPHKLKGHGDDITALAFAPSAPIVATGSRDTTVKLWDRWSGRELRTLSGHGGPVVGVAFLPDGATLASEAGDGSITMWHVASGEALGSWRIPQ